MKNQSSIGNRKSAIVAVATLLFCSLFFIPRSLLAQQPLVQTSDLQIITPALPSVTSVNAAVVGNPGPATYYYWVVAKYSTGNAAPSPAAIVANAPNVLSATNYVQVSWQAVSGASSYDLLRTTSPQLPTTPAAIAVATAVTATAYSDQGAALASYTLSTAPAGQTALEISPNGVECGSSSAGTGAAMQWLWSEVCGPDAPPANPSPMNDEFNSNSLSSQWSWLNQNGITTTESQGWLALNAPIQNGEVLQGITQPIGATPLEFVLKASSPLASFGQGGGAVIGLGLYESNTTKAAINWFGLDIQSSIENTFIQPEYWINGAYSSVIVPWVRVESQHEYLKEVDDGANTIFLASQDGRSWNTLGSGLASAEFTTAPNEVGIFFLANGGTLSATMAIPGGDAFGVDFFRQLPMTSNQVTDSFTGSSDLNSYVSELSPLPNGWSIASNTLSNSGNGSASIKFKFSSTTATAYAGLGFRANTSSGARYTVIAYPPSSQIQLFQYPGWSTGSGTELASAAWTPDTNQHTLTVQFFGNGLTVYVDGVQKIVWPIAANSGSVTIDNYGTAASYQDFTYVNDQYQ
jgi:hypothetical protein